MSNLTKKTRETSSAVTARSAALDRIRAARPAKPLAGSRAAPLPERRPRLVFGVDATASREPSWASAQRITDRMFGAIPGALDVALAVHGAGRVHTFTAFSADVAQFRAQAAAVRCQAGNTQLCALMQRTLDAGGVRVLSYIGDAFEEVSAEALALADRFRLRGIKAVILADDAGEEALAVFQEIARRTGGAVLDFRAGELDLMGEVLEAVAALAIGGRKLLAARKTPGATLLLGHIEA
jgi:hypothetical protein